MTDQGPEVAPLVAESVSVRYGGRTVLSEVSFAVPRGSVFALLGRNGAGKSSLVRCLLGQQKPSGGRALLFGRDAWAGRREAMCRVGVLPEDPDAPPAITARQLADFCRPLYPRWDGPGVSARLERAGVPSDVPFGRLSKGQKGAVMLALCLGHGPELLVLDDPTLGLDPVARRDLYEELIGDLADRGTTVFLTTHDLEGVEGLADRVAVLRGTRLVLDETMDRLKARFRRIRCSSPAGANGAALDWGPLRVLQARRRDWGLEAVVSNFDEEGLARFRAAAGARDVEVGPLSLEEIFVAVAAEEGGRS